MHNGARIYTCMYTQTHARTHTRARKHARAHPHPHHLLKRSLLKEKHELNTVLRESRVRLEDDALAEQVARAVHLLAVVYVADGAVVLVDEEFVGGEVEPGC